MSFLFSWSLVAFSISLLLSHGNSQLTSTGLNNITEVVEVSTVLGPSSNIPETATFIQTTYSGFVNLASTILTNKVITVTEGSVTVTTTHSYEISPSGIGWTIPTASNGEPILPEPSFLPGNSSTSGISSNASISTTASTSSLTRPTTIANSTVLPSVNPTTGLGSSSAIPITSLGSSSVGSITSNSSATSSSLVITASPQTTLTATSNGTIVANSTTAIDVSVTSTSGSLESTSGTDSASGITIASSTGGGSSISGTAAITSTITSAPSGFSGVTLPGTAFTANEWITTTDSNHHTTLVPFVLIGGGRGVELWDLPPIPNVEFELPGLPEFHLPCIKLLGISVGDCDSPPVNDGPSPSASPSSEPTGSPSTQLSSASATATSSSPSSSCTATNTVSDCIVSCASAGSASSCASYTTTCTQTSAACSAQGTTTTVAGTGACIATPPSTFAQATQTFCQGSCLPGPTSIGSAVPSYSTSGPNPTPDYRKRAVAGRVTMDPIKKRAAPSAISTLGGCALATPAASPLNLPGWPSIFTDMLQPEQAGNLAPQYDTISRYDRATSAGCIFTTTRLSANDFLNAPNWQDYNGNSFGNINNQGSLDHAYEKDWLKQFFNQIISSTNAQNALTCAQAGQYFFPRSSTCSYNLLQDIWNELAGDNNLKFIAMSQYLNGNAKGMFFPAAGSSFQQSFVNDPDWQIPPGGAGWVWPSNGNNQPPYSAEDALYTMISYFETVLYGVLEVKSDNMLDLIDSTNNGIYFELQQLDSLVTGNVNNLFGNTDAYLAAFPNGLAEAYKDFITNTIEPQITTPPQYLTTLWKLIYSDLYNAWSLSDVQNDPTNQQTWTDIYNLYTAHIQHYYVDNAFTWEYTFSFSWDITQTKKRGVDSLLRRQGSCALPTNSTSLQSPTSTTPGTTSSTTVDLGSSSTALTTLSSGTLSQLSSTAVPTTIPGTSINVTSTEGSVTPNPSTATEISTAPQSSVLQSSSAPPASAPPSPTPASITIVPATSTSSSDAGACVGNQIEGSCTQASLPSATPDSGPEQPVCDKDGTGDALRFNATQAAQAAATYCSNLISANIVLDAQSTSPKPGSVPGGAENGGQISLAVLFDVDSCDPGTATADQKVDFAAMGQDMCYQNLYSTLAEFCAQDPTWSDYNPDYSLEGGVWAGSCALWSMGGLPAQT